MISLRDKGTFNLSGLFNLSQIVNLYDMVGPWSRHQGDKGELDKVKFKEWHSKGGKQIINKQTE